MKNCVTKPINKTIFPSLPYTPLPLYMVLFFFVYGIVLGLIMHLTVLWSPEGAGAHSLRAYMANIPRTPVQFWGALAYGFSKLLVLCTGIAYALLIYYSAILTLIWLGY